MKFPLIEMLELKTILAKEELHPLQNTYGQKALEVIKAFDLETLLEKATKVYKDEDAEFWGPGKTCGKIPLSGIVIGIKKLKQGVTKNEIIEAMRGGNAYINLAGLKDLADRIEAEGIIE